MDITKILSAMMVGGVMLAGTSCNKLDDVEDLSSMSILVSNYIVPMGPDEEVTVQHNCLYNLRFENVKHNMTLGTTDLMLPGGAACSFTSNEMKFEYYANEFYYSSDFNNGNAHLSNGMQLTSLSGYVTNIVNEMNPINDIFLNNVMVPMLVAEYNVGNYIVRTFSTNSYFTGETRTSYQMPGQPMSTYSTTDCTYRVNFAADMKSANVVLYNVKFSEQMPMTIQAVILRSLPVTLTKNGYVISATDIIPDMMEAGEAVPNPSKKFDFIKIKSSKDMTKIECEYIVAGMFKGEFAGACCDHFSFD